jgi:hypothetical protein
MQRAKPLIVVASDRTGVADGVVARLRRDGAVAYAAHSADGCLRVASSIGPDIVLLDPSLPARVEKLLRAHPASANAQFFHLTEAQAQSESSTHCAIAA